MKKIIVLLAAISIAASSFSQVMRPGQNPNSIEWSLVTNDTVSVWLGLDASGNIYKGNVLNGSASVVGNYTISDTLNIESGLLFSANNFFINNDVAIDSNLTVTDTLKLGDSLYVGANSNWSGASAIWKNDLYNVNNFSYLYFQDSRVGIGATSDNELSNYSNLLVSSTDITMTSPGGVNITQGDLSSQGNSYLGDAITDTSAVTGVMDIDGLLNVSSDATFSASITASGLTSTSSASQVIVREGNVMKVEAIADINSSTLEHVNTDSLTINSYFVCQGETLYVKKQLMVDDGTITMPANTTGYGDIVVNDGSTYVTFTWKVDGTVTLITNTADVDDADTDTKFCIYDSGTSIVIKNRLGAQYYARFNLHYSTN